MNKECWPFSVNFVLKIHFYIYIYEKTCEDIEVTEFSLKQENHLPFLETLAEDGVLSFQHS